MTESPPIVPKGPAPDAGSAGAMLRAAREAAGLTVDALSQQLKLSPRQVKALEDGDYANLPGRTFVRGFVRNYARAVGIDAEAVLAAIPGAVEAPALDRSTIGHAHRPIGELPTSGRARSGSWARWLIPLVLLAAIGAAALYEYLRPGDLQRGFGTRTLPVRPALPDPVAPPASMPSSGTPLPNPILSGPVSEAPRADGALPPPAPAVETAPAGAASPLAPPGPAGGGAIVTPPVTAPAAAPTPPPAAGEATLVITYRASSWTEVRDRDGKVVLQVTGTPGTSQTVTGKAPFDLTLGSAGENSITWRGAPFDLAPHLRQNVARVRLP
jgi:cytoskeleton protein RodZ